MQESKQSEVLGKQRLSPLGLDDTVMRKTSQPGEYREHKHPNQTMQAGLIS